MIREMGNVELFELCEAIPKVQCSDCFLNWNQGVICCTCGHLLVEANPINVLVNGDWMLSQFRTTSSRKDDRTVLGTARPKHRRASCGPQRADEVSKRIMMEFTIVSNEIQYFVTRISKLAGPKRNASQWIYWHKKTTPTAYSLRHMRYIRKIGISH